MYSNTGSSDSLTIYSDADYAGDARSRKLTSGVLTQYIRGAVTWSSIKQSSVALSTTESELSIWLSRLYEEITSVTLEQPSLYVDSLRAKLI